MEIGVFFIAAALVIFVLGFINGNKKVVQRIELREKQVSSLINELGDVRQENTLLQEKLKKQIEKMAKFSLVFSSFKKEVKDQATEGGIRRVSDNPIVSPETPDGQINILFPQAKAMPLQEENRLMNVLIAGHHQKLTDTIMLVMLDREKQKITLFSIPRDLFVNGRKINEYYFSYGALELVKQIEEITDLEVNHYVVVSMEAFEKLISTLGGIDLDVEKPLYDALYPTDQNGYQTFSMATGRQHMDGAMALKFARSRTGTSDFDRAARQQKIVNAIFKQVKTMNFLKDLAVTKQLYEAIGSLFETNLGFLDLLLFYEQFQNAEIYGGNVLSTSNYLTASRNLQGQYILLPKKEDFSEIKRFVRELSSHGSTVSP